MPDITFWSPFNNPAGNNNAGRTIGNLTWKAVIVGVPLAAAVYFGNKGIEKTKEATHANLPVIVDSEVNFPIQKNNGKINEKNTSNLKVWYDSKNDLMHFKYKDALRTNYSGTLEIVDNAGNATKINTHSDLENMLFKFKKLNVKPSGPLNNYEVDVNDTTYGNNIELKRMANHLKADIPLYAKSSDVKVKPKTEMLNTTSQKQGYDVRKVY